MAEKEFLSFDEALHELRLKEEELKRLVSEGEIRAFRDGETMKLRKSDVENLRAELQGGEVVDLGQPSEELVFEDDTDLDAGMATEEISEADTILEEDVPEVSEVELGDEDVSAEDEDGELLAVRGGETPAYVPEPYEGGLFRSALVLTSVVMCLGIPLCMAISQGHVTSAAKSIAGLFGHKF